MTAAATGGAVPVDVTVAVCTRDRASSLSRLLSSMTRLQVPKGLTWKLLVVDNGSTDGTAAVLEGYRHRLPLCVVHEETPGVAHARNAVLDNVRSRWLLSADDDVTVSSAWLGNHVRAFERYRDAAFVAGDIHPVFVGAAPDWRRAAMDSIATAYAAFSVGDVDVRVEAGVSARLIPFGANLGLSLEHVRGMRFQTGLGRQPGARLLGGEETELLNRLMQAGKHGWLVAGNPVLHWIEADRQTSAYVERYFYGQGWQSGVRELAGSLPRRVWYMAKMRALQSAWPLVARFGSETARLRVLSRTSRFQGALDGRRGGAETKTIGFGVAGAPGAAQGHSDRQGKA